MFSVIFEVHPAQGKRDEYLEQAKELKPIIETIDGFMDNDRFESRRRPGWVLSLSTWRDEKSVIRWRTQWRHNLSQEKGRSEIFSDYQLRVGEITADTHPPMPVVEHRFDTTETGASKLCTIVELTPRKGEKLPEHDDAVLAAISLDKTAKGLNVYDVYDSIYHPGNVLVLGSWTGPDDAAAFQPSTPSGAESLRLRSVRVIREYGMFDRRETTKYYPEVEPRQ
jgi:heme-degrading monooxygenase HmoA